MSRSKPRVGVDVDGVLADLTALILGALNRMHGTSFREEDMTTWRAQDLFPGLDEAAFWREIMAPGFHRSIPVYPGAQEGLRALQEVADVYIVTSHLPFAPTWVSERDAWLMEHFHIPHAKIVHTEAKYVFLGRALIDDRPSNVARWQAEHPRGVGILWARSCNRAYEEIGIRHRVDSWAGAIELVTGSAP